ncbi:MAG TPA: NAD(P)-dependent oxidoreductase [Pseudonocardiaceae bacterium]|nr:NAD(P)-dependent oxidoreductase [Pseudonocardiaceae bacterium]
MTVAWIGLGAMGLPMARRLATGGHDVVGYDVAADRAGEGITPATSPAAAAAGADAVFVMVADADQARAALSGDDGVLVALRPGATVVVCSTIGPAAMAELADAIRAAGGKPVDAPVSGGTARAATGELLVMAGAAPDDLAAVRDLLETLAAQVVPAGDRPGDGQRLKLVNQLLCGVHIAVAAEALAFARALGLDPALCHEALGQGAAASFMFADRGARMAAESFTDVRSAVDIFVKDMGLVADAAAGAGFDAELAAHAHRRFQLAHDAGFGRLDDSSVIRTYLDQAGYTE